MLGNKIEKVKLQNRKKSLNKFIKRVNILAKFARKKNVSLLIENNVLSKKNYLEFRSNPLLMTSDNEMIKIMKNTPENVNLLIDVGHLKVTAKTLKFNKEKTLKKVNKWIKGYHLSENNGLEDSNKTFNSKSWFFRNLNSNVDYISVEIYIKNLKLIKSQIKLVKKLLNGRK